MQPVCGPAAARTMDLFSSKGRHVQASDLAWVRTASKKGAPALATPPAMTTTSGLRTRSKLTEATATALAASSTTERATGSPVSASAKTSSQPQRSLSSSSESSSDALAARSQI